MSFALMLAWGPHIAHMKKGLEAVRQEKGIKGIQIEKEKVKSSVCG